MRALRAAEPTAGRLGAFGGPDALIIAYGGACWAHRRGAGPALPAKDIRAAFRAAMERLARRDGAPRAAAVLVCTPEFRTTMLCRLCHRPMAARIVRPPGRGIERVDRNFRLCSHCGSDAGPALRSRDGNAAANIAWRCWVELSGEQLPDAWRRVPNAPQQQQHLPPMAAVG